MNVLPRGCLVIIFNHPYPDNVGKLKEIYSNRFARVVFLMPFEQMNDADVMTVYRGSYTSQGFIADARQFLSNIDADFFVFAADDLLINPDFGERELYARLHLDRFDGYIPQFRSLSVPSVQIGNNEDFGDDWHENGRGPWFWAERVLSRVHAPKHHIFGSGCEEAWSYLPHREEALSRFAAFGMASLASPKHGSATIPWHHRDLPYPLAVGMSDFFVVRNNALKKFYQCCGALAALDIFVEVAIPTALVLSCETLGTSADTSLQCKWTYTGSDKPIGLVDAIDYSTVCQKFHENLLFIHPVKFSKVEM
jgi:hypothetical protein